MTHYAFWLLEYAHIPEVPLASLVYGRHDGGMTRLPYCYGVLVGGGRVIMLDCGLNLVDHGMEFAKRFGVANYLPPFHVLAEIGLAPEEVTDVILTHAHFDHMGGLKHFPKAKFYIQESELANWVRALGRGRQFRWLLDAIDPGDILDLVDIARQGRLVAVKGTAPNIIDGIDLVLAPDSHTAGSQYVVVHPDGDALRSYVYTGDLIYRHENIHGGSPDDPRYVPVGYAVGSQTRLVETTDEMLGQVDGNWHRFVIPHEPEMGRLYPTRLSASGHSIIRIC